MRKFLIWTSVAALTGFLSACHQTSAAAAAGVRLTYQRGGSIAIRNNALVIRLTPQHVLSAGLAAGEGEITLAGTPAGAIPPSDYVVVGGKAIRKFTIDYGKIVERDAATRLGRCRRVEIPSRATEGNLALERVLDLDLCPALPQSVILTATYRNVGAAPVRLERVVQASQVLSRGGKNLWTFRGSSIGSGRDDAFPLPSAFETENPVGQMLPSGHGGGIPVNDFWNERAGVGIGHSEAGAVAGWLPVKSTGEFVEIGFETRPDIVLEAGEAFTTPGAFVTVHHGDFYEALASYRSILLAQGVTFPKPDPSFYEPVWWTYAFGHNFRPQEVYNSVPKFQELGIRWLIINNRWWDHYGDWMPRTDKFGGEAGFHQFLARLRQDRLKTLLWWLPYGVQVNEFPRSGLYNNPAGRPKQSPAIEEMIAASARVAVEHRDWLITDRQGKLVPISRRLAALCPAYGPAFDYMVQLAVRMVRDWQADGFYTDVVYTVPSCYNPAHHHSSPYDSVKELPRLFLEFRKVIERYNPQGMLMLCPCGTLANHCLLHAMHEPVTADPVGAEQIRWRVKMYKALLGPRAPVFADRVESTHLQRLEGSAVEAGSDFASCMGTGGIIGTIFVWPKIDKAPGDLEYAGEMDGMRRLLLTPEKATWWKKWFDLYHRKMLSSGEFLDLYTLGFDEPEGYAVRKEGKLYYAFFAPAPRAFGIDAPPRLPEPQDHSWQGRLELRGLEKSKRYQVTDYENGKELGHIEGSAPYLNSKFTNHQLLEVSIIR